MPTVELSRAGQSYKSVRGTIRHFLSTNAATNTTAPVAFAPFSGITAVASGTSYLGRIAIDSAYTDGDMFRVGDLVTVFASGGVASSYNLVRTPIIAIRNGEIDYMLPANPPGGAAAGAGGLILNFGFKTISIFGKKAAKTNNTGAVVVDFSPPDSAPTLFPISIAAGGVYTYTMPERETFDIALVQFQVATSNDGVICVFS